MKLLAKRADAQKVEEKEAEEDRSCDGVCIRSDLERVGDEGKKEQQVGRMNWRLLLENVVREKERKKKHNGNGNHGQLTPDDGDAKKRTTKQFDQSINWASIVLNP